MINFFLNLSRIKKILLALLFDIILSLLSTWLAFTIRLEEFNYPNEKNLIIYFYFVVIPIILFYFYGIYSSIFRYFDKFFIFKIAKVIIVYSLISTLTLLLIKLPQVPRSIGIIQPLIFFILIISQRTFLSSIIIKYSDLKKKIISEENFLFYGITNDNVNIAKVLRDTYSYKIIGFIRDVQFDKSDNQSIKEVVGIKVLDVKDLKQLVLQNLVKNIIISDNLIESHSNKEKNKLIKKFLEIGLKVFKVKNLFNIDKNIETNIILKKIDIEDVLGRKKIKPDNNLLQKNNFAKNILITGGVGSIGSEITRKIISLRPKKVFILDNNEFEIYNFENYLNKLKLNCDVEFILGDIKDEIYLKNFFNKNFIDTIYHCAAYKHVPILEKNILSCIKNNILGTYNLLNTINQSNVKNFIFISTDKAVNPKNIMGLSKRICELFIRSYAKENKKIKYSIVRFGNVLDSKGSVLPLFKEQIKNGGPITITDINMRRYFMTIPEAAELVIQAGALDSKGDIFILDMGKEIKIYDLVLKLLEINNLSLRNKKNPNGDIEVKIIGMRPGEKISEELAKSNSIYYKTLHPRIKKISDRKEIIFFDQEKKINQFKVFLNNSDINGLRNFLNSFK
jgi:FlaA1/EpsC-like NDP-sugar epimerase